MGYIANCYGASMIRPVPKQSGRFLTSMTLRGSSSCKWGVLFWMFSIAALTESNLLAGPPLIGHFVSFGLDGSLTSESVLEARRYRPCSF